MSSSKAIAASFAPDADVDLAERHRHGDETAFDEVYARYSAMVYGLSLRTCSDPSRAQDLSQEVFIRVFRSLSRFRGRSSLKTWVYRVTLNHCRSRLGRKRVLTEPLDTPAVERKVRDPGRGPEDLTLSADAGRIVTAGLLRLPRRFREAVVLGI
jgi:RNA polymerase sigma-70 factor (ECF subfamily)